MGSRPSNNDELDARLAKHNDGSAVSFTAARRAANRLSILRRNGAPAVRTGPAPLRLDFIA